ncbi:MAG: hypothetical protein NC043_04780 [Muribaculaceae bacterium]|nr:hypothetical protein [Muribaculaceae bacterium]
MQKWIVIIIVCLIYCIGMEPITKAVKKRVKNKYVAFLIDFAIGFCILMALYGVSALLGYDIADM